MHQHEWIKLLKVDSVQAVKKLLLLEVNCSNGYANTPVVVVRNAVPGLKSANHSKILKQLDEGLCKWFQTALLQPPPKGIEAYSSIKRCWDAINLVEEFILPKTTNELLDHKEDYLKWFGNIPNMDFITSPLNGFENFINKPQIKEPK